MRLHRHNILALNGHLYLLENVTTNINGQMKNAKIANNHMNQIHKLLTFWSGNMGNILELIACYYVSFLLGSIAGATIMFLLDRAVLINEYTDI